MDLIGAINELKRDKKIKIENQRRIETLKIENYQEVDISVKIKHNIRLLDKMEQDLNNLRSKMDIIDERMEDSFQMKEMMKNPESLLLSGDFGSENLDPNKFDLIDKKSSKSSFKQSIIKSPSIKVKKNELLLPRINTIFSKKKNRLRP